MAKKDTPKYQNNPFMIGLDGLQLTFRNARSIGMYAIVLTAVSFLLGVMFYVAGTVAQLAAESRGGADVSYSAPTALDTGGVTALIAFIVAGFIVYFAISLLLFGVLDYAAAMTAKGKKVGLQEAFGQVLRNFPSYFFMYLLFVIKVALWSLLLIVPGIIMFNRYILAGTVFFAEGKRGNAALKRSAELTKGAWLTTYGGMWVWNIISQGLATMVFLPGNFAILYRQLADRTDKNDPKPPAHILSWLTLLVPIGLMLLYILLIVLVAVLVAVTSTAP